ncbi:MAG: TetR/AcrR family transcriptional regulator [Oscillospiraceae bacterium]|nr:TetR/AcrR family transcriptional regulator [Oscillospiraceae bacterium]
MSKVKEKQLRRRSEIIEAVIPLIASVPFDALSVNEICLSAGISVGSFYHYFEKKSDLLVGLLGLIDEYLEAEVYPRLGEGTATDKLFRFALEWARYVEAHGIERSKLISSVAPANTDLGGQKRSSLIYLEKLMSEGQAEGRISDGHSPENLAELYLLALRAITTDWSRQGGSYSIVEKMEVFISIWLKGIAPIK